MSRRIIKQPDGKYAVWSSTVDDFIFLNAVPEELVSERVREASSLAKDQTLQEIEELNLGIRRGSGPHTWEEALSLRKRIHGRTSHFKDDPFLQEY